MALSRFLAFKELRVQRRGLLLHLLQSVEALLSGSQRLGQESSRRGLQRSGINRRGGGRRRRRDHDGRLGRRLCRAIVGARELHGDLRFLLLDDALDAFLAVFPKRELDGRAGGGQRGESEGEVGDARLASGGGVDGERRVLLAGENLADEAGQAGAGADFEEDARAVVKHALDHLRELD